jgi:dTDP-4-dehydrorhamnose 3,5-epimerase
MGTLLNGAAFLTPLKIIENEKGNVLHALKASDSNFRSFGEAYFSMIHYGEFKGWKLHKCMILNLVVPLGHIRFYLVHGNEELATTVDLSVNNYQRLTVNPGTWVGFEGISQGVNLLLNIASVEHDPSESVSQNKSLFAHLFTDF